MITAELREATTVTGWRLDLAPGADVATVVRAMAADAAARAPNEPADNPSSPGAESLRATLQSAFAAAAG